MQSQKRVITIEADNARRMNSEVNCTPPVDRLSTHDPKRVNWHVIPRTLTQDRRSVLQHPHGEAMRRPTIFPVDKVVPLVY